MQKGVSLYLALMIIAILLSIILGLSTILISQIRVIKGMGDSVTAFCAAETGIERVLYEAKLGENIIEQQPYQDSFNNASYIVNVYDHNNPECADADYYCIKSVGTYLGTKRAIEVIR